jgi:hypothetical protein
MRYLHGPNAHVSNWPVDGAILREDVAGGSRFAIRDAMSGTNLRLNQASAGDVADGVSFNDRTRGNKGYFIRHEIGFI